ncbi:LysR family transcriptional regulator [Nocardioides albus]|uniref:DNA-binding transcriptional LysR family regulator n=1 Tax=Nocardioides albus TaxID=1841 RepID=A0A7W5A0E2_9ACTN|nr:LysR family transcriptional regulator [Nocardioides albus]MBB3087317.1 DNA-binding transcriptional LysR family regulator [Nocardioides albus]GGU08123.1 LysR family transcriptional regulator [Nocardioides albus]
MAASPSTPPSADQLLVLLEVARSGRFTTAARSLGLTHTTVSRNISALERSLGGRILVRGSDGWALTALGERAARAAEGVAASLARLAADEPADPVAGVVRMSTTDGFAAYVASPAVAALRQDHPELAVEIVTVTRQAAQHRSGVDIEVVVGEPAVMRGRALHLGGYELGLYASPDYLERHGRPGTIEEAVRHRLVYFVDSMLQVDDLDVPRRLLPGIRDAVTSTNVFVHVEATRAGAGLGLLPCFMADRHPDLVRLLREEIHQRLPYWAVVHPESWRRPAVAAVVGGLREQMADQEDALLGR